MYADSRFISWISSTRRLALPVLLALAGWLTPAISFGGNINWGPLQGDLGFQTGFQYNSNLNNNTNYVQDVYWLVGPTFNGGLNLPIHFAGNEGESLSLYTGFAYSEEYSLLGNPNQENFTTPVTAALKIPLTFGEWKFLFTDNFVYQPNSVVNAVAIGAPQVEQYSNLASLSLVRNLGKAFVTLAASRSDAWSPSEISLQNTTYQFSFTPAFLVRDNYTVFWQNTYGLVYQASPTLQNSVGYSSSVGVSGQITPFLTGTISLGYAHSQLKEKVLGPGTGIFGGIFDPETIPAYTFDGVTTVAAVSYQHPLNPYTTYSLSAFDSPGVTAVLVNSSLSSTYGGAFTISHRLTPKITLGPVFNYIHTATLGPSSTGEIVDLYGIGFSMQRQILPNITGSLQYNYYYHADNLPGETYDVNIVNVTVNYTF